MRDTLVMLEFVATGNDSDAAAEVAANLGGISYLADPDDPRELPFRAMVRAMTSDLDALASAAGTGLYTIFSRTIKARPEAVSPGQPSTGVTGIFPLVHHPDLTHTQTDTHWRDTHAPLALAHHPGMWDYTQCSVLQTMAGPVYDGFAMVAFASMQDMKERFFANDEGRAIIHADVASFADTKASPRRVVATETIYGQRPPVPPVTWPHE